MRHSNAAVGLNGCRWSRKEGQNADKEKAEPAVHWLSGKQRKEGADPGSEDTGGRVLY